MVLVPTLFSFAPLPLFLPTLIFFLCHFFVDAPQLQLVLPVGYLALIQCLLAQIYTLTFPLIPWQIVLSAIGVAKAMLIPNAMLFVLSHP